MFSDTQKLDLNSSLIPLNPFRSNYVFGPLVLQANLNTCIQTCASVCCGCIARDSGLKLLSTGSLCLDMQQREMCYNYNQ